MTLRYGRSICSDIQPARRREWLCTNGLGGYAMGTIAGSLERTYHGLLIEAIGSPVDRVLRLAKLDPIATISGRPYALDANAWVGGAVAPDGTPGLESFRLEDGGPVWVFLLRGRRIERRIAMVPGEHTTVVSWRLLDVGPPVSLHFKALGSLRVHHHTTHDGGPRAWISAEGGDLIVGQEGVRPLRILSDGVAEAGHGEVYNNFLLRMEAERGLGHADSHRLFGELRLELVQGQTRTLRVTTEEAPVASGAEGFERASAYARGLLERRARVSSDDPELLSQLVLAADQFIVRREVDGQPGRTILAGYPWFGDWGRDTMIALPGLTLSTNRAEVAAQILRTFARFVDQGMLPNRFPDGEPPEYNTVDATLWFFHAIGQTVEALDAAEADALLADLVPVLDDIIRHHVEGTRFNIRVDADGLLSSGADGVQLTWMDARVGTRVITPRQGKPVEVNGQWLDALCALAAFRKRLGRSDEDLLPHIERARAAFARYWNPDTGALNDVIDGPDGRYDGSIRPNQLIALALSTCPLPLEQRRSAVRVAGEHLLTSHGLRSLSPGHPDYVGAYEGPVAHRDGCYHQGTTWGWLIGPWVRARLAIGDDPEIVRNDLLPLLDQMNYGVIGNVSEIFDGDAPFDPRGAPAQAWSVAEILSSWDALRGA